MSPQRYTIDQLKSALTEQSLVVINGPQASGKTRLAYQISIGATRNVQARDIRRKAADIEKCCWGVNTLIIDEASPNSLDFFLENKHNFSAAIIVTVLEIDNELHQKLHDAGVPVLTPDQVDHINHAMIDLEKLGTQPGCVILSIGAVIFNPATGLQTGVFYTEINTDDCLLRRLSISPSTLAWWENQSNDAKALLDRCASTPVKLKDALQALAEFLELYAPEAIWANSPSFDLAILGAAYKTLCTDTPWKFRQETDCRTLVALGRSLGIDPKKALPFTGTPHNALAAARHQATYISAIWRHVHALNTTEGTQPC